MDSKLSPVFYSRSFGNIAQPGIKFEVDHLAWEALGDCKSGRLVATARGGREKGGASLTESGRVALRLYRQLEAESHSATGQVWSRLRRLLKT